MITLAGGRADSTSSTSSTIGSSSSRGDSHPCDGRDRTSTSCCASNPSTSHNFDGTGCRYGGCYDGCYGVYRTLSTSISPPTYPLALKPGYVGGYVDSGILAIWNRRCIVCRSKRVRSQCVCVSSTAGIPPIIHRMSVGVDGTIGTMGAKKRPSRGSRRWRDPRDRMSGCSGGGLLHHMQDINIVLKEVRVGISPARTRYREALSEAPRRMALGEEVVAE